VLELDLGREDLVLDDGARAELRRCDVLIHSAAAVEFDKPPPTCRPRRNLLGASRLVRTLRDLDSRGRTWSTARRRTSAGCCAALVREELPFDPGP